MTLDIPPRLLGTFKSRIPTPEQARLLPMDWGAAYVENAAEWTQYLMSRAWGSLNLQIPEEAQSFLDIVPLALDARKTWQTAGSLGDKLGAISQGTLKALELVMDAIGLAVSAVPVIGMVARVGINIQTAFWNNWVVSRQLPPAEPGFRYDFDTDERYQQDIIRAVEAGDVTSIFLPPVRLEDLQLQLVQAKRRRDRRDWLITPKGDMWGMGFLPGGLGLQVGYEGRGPQLYSDYLPGALSAATIAWELARGVLRPFVDFEAIRSAWLQWYEILGEYGNSRTLVIPDSPDVKKALDRKAVGNPQEVIDDALRPIWIGEIAAAAGERAGSYRYFDGGIWKGGHNERTMADVVSDVIGAVDSPLIVVPGLDLRPRRKAGSAAAVVATVGAVGVVGWLAWKFLLR